MTGRRAQAQAPGTAAGGPAGHGGAKAGGMRTGKALQKGSKSQPATRGRGDGSRRALLCASGAVMSHAHAEQYKEATAGPQAAGRRPKAAKRSNERSPGKGGD